MLVPGGARGSARGESLGMPAARIARVALGLCEGLEQLHEVIECLRIIFLCIGDSRRKDDHNRKPSGMRIVGDE